MRQTIAVWTTDIHARLYGVVIGQTAVNSEVAPGRAVATACVYFRRFSAAHEVCERDPRLVAPACLYLACKAEESQLQAKLLFYAMRKVAGAEDDLHASSCIQRQ